MSTLFQISVLLQSSIIANTYFMYVFSVKKVRLGGKIVIRKTDILLPLKIVFNVLKNEQCYIHRISDYTVKPELLTETDSFFPVSLRHKSKIH